MRRRLLCGGFVVMLLAVAALLARWWTPVEPAMRMRMALRMKPPFEAGWLGTDQLGRDVLSLLMIGAGNSLSVAVLAVATGAAAGTILGLAASLAGGWWDRIVARGCDLLFAFPPILSAMVLGAALGSGFGSAVIAIALFTTPVFARTVRADAIRVLARDYVRAARALGVSGGGILRRHVLPNIAGGLVVQIALQLGLAILTESGLSFLGLGTPPPAPSWGRMLADAQTYLATAPWLAIAPGIAIALAVLGFQLLGDGLRDWLDPRRPR